MKNKKEICIHGDLLWINGKDHSIRSAEYQKGCFQKVWCNINDEICNFRNYTDCSLWEKKDKE